MALGLLFLCTVSWALDVDVRNTVLVLLVSTPRAQNLLRDSQLLFTPH